jgi:hypothetical protein
VEDTHAPLRIVFGIKKNPLVSAVIIEKGIWSCAYESLYLSNGLALLDLTNWDS